MADRLLKTVLTAATPSLSNGSVQYQSTGISNTDGIATAVVRRTGDRSIGVRVCADVPIGDNNTQHYLAMLDLTELLRVEEQLAATRKPDGTPKYDAAGVIARSAEVRRALAAAILATIPA